MGELALSLIFVNGKITEMDVVADPSASPSSIWPCWLTETVYRVVVAASASMAVLR